MHRFLAAAAAAVLVCGGAHAAEGASPTAGNTAVGVGIICNTAEQAQQFVNLRSNAASSDQAMHTVNANAQEKIIKQERPPMLNQSTCCDLPSGAVL